MLEATTFAHVAPARPRRDDVLARHDALLARVARAATAADVLAAIRDWDALRRDIQTWEAWVSLRFHQATGDPERKAAADRANADKPLFSARDAGFKRAILATPFRDAIDAAFGTQAAALWSCDVAAVDDRIVERLTVESSLVDEYTALLAGARIPLGDAAYSLPGIGAFSEDADRAVREAAARAKWAYFDERSDELDRLYDALVRERTAAARELGFPAFTPLGYLRMRRTDYDSDDVAAVREEVVRDIVPLCARLAADQARRIGVDRLMPWDYEVYDAGERLRPPASDDALVAAARVALGRTSPAFGAFVDRLRDGDLLDLPLRDGKAGGGFCTSFSTYGLPYVFANTAGTTHDVNVLVHELGHALQCYQSREQPLADYLWPTFDAAEIDSMGMEFLVRPHLEAFFGDAADRYRRRHLASSLMMIPYGCAVDHFQHLVYERPGATPQERNEMWKSLERRYLPWRDAGGIAHLERGGAWQQQRHIFAFPFYYIDYVLAMSCALQFWTASLDDAGDAVARYDRLCALGGGAPFQTLVRSAGLRSPFDGGVFASIAERAGRALA